MARAQAKPRSVRRTSDEDLVARAEAAMAQLSSHFADWMAHECRRLEGLCRRVEATPADADLILQLFRAAHDIKGEAATFGYPVVERVTASLCRLISEAPHRERVPIRLMASHVAAVRRSLHSEGDIEALARGLELATARFLADAKAAEDSPQIPSPPLAP